MHEEKICASGCYFAEKRIMLSRTGTQEDWLYRCNKIGKLISSDSVINEVGCASYTITAPQNPADKLAEELIKEVDKRLEGFQSDQKTLDDVKTEKKPNARTKS